MEIEPNVMPAEHSKFERMVQKMSVGQTNIQMDSLEITVNSVDQEIFKLAYLKPGTEDYWQSGEITSGGSADQFKAAIQGFYTGIYKVQPIVTATFYDASGVETT
jgi:hypothetical protein